MGAKSFIIKPFIDHLARIIFLRIGTCAVINIYSFKETIIYKNINFKDLTLY